MFSGEACCNSAILLWTISGSYGYRSFACGVATMSVVPASAAIRSIASDSSRQSEPSSSPGRIWNFGAAAVNQPGHGMRLVPLIELHCFVEYSLAFGVQRGNRFVEIPGTFIVVGGQHASATHR